MVLSRNNLLQPLIYLGPSLPLDEAAAICPGEYRPPIARGDLTRHAGSIARTILIIDGKFLHVRSVSPKEILEVLDQGHIVYGAASIGALRAVEMERFGMHGIGRIFEAYRDGMLSADDEVAVAFDQDTLQPMSVPLVNMRVALEESVDAGLIERAEAIKLIDVAHSLYYPFRTYSQILQLSTLPIPKRNQLLNFLNNQATDQKAEDARASLRFIAEGEATRMTAISNNMDVPCRPRMSTNRLPFDELPPARKIGGRDCVRTIAVRDTLDRLENVRSLVGITRLGDVRGLDFLGVPNYVAVRPSRYPWCNSVYSGKGLTDNDAKVGAQMEALEMVCALDDRLPIKSASYNALQQSGHRALDPDSLNPCYLAPQNLKDICLEWIKGWDVESGEQVLVPVDVVLFRRDQRPTYWKISSNGLASGNTLSEALAHGLAEVIERDAETMFRLATDYAQFPGMLRIVAGKARIEQPLDALPPPRSFPLVRLSTLPSVIIELVERICRTGLSIAVRNITSDINVSTFLCALYEPTGDWHKQLVHYGCGTHPDPHISVRRAITEATQSRVTAIQGAREDLDAGAMVPSNPPLEWFHPGVDEIDFGSISGAYNQDIRDDIRFMIDRLKEAKLREVIAVNIGNPSFGFEVIKVIVPSLELAFHRPIGPDELAFGWRARRYFEINTKDKSRVIKVNGVLVREE